jgi:hypothetical protein
LAWRESFGRHRVELLLFAGAFVIYALSSAELLSHQSLAPHFVWQADAFLHGRLDVQKPPNLNDWVLQGGRWYVSFPPFPALLMMPFVAIWGLRLNDVAFTIVFAALNVALFYRLLLRACEPRPQFENAVFALLFGFGTLAWSCAIRGEVWFTAEIIGVTLTLLYLQFSLGASRPFLAGLAVACAAITRTPLAFSALFFLFEAWRTSRPVLGKKLLPFFGAIVLVAIPMAWMNYTRFGAIGEFGHSHLYNNRVNAQVARFGLFHYAFLERNLHDAFTRLPEIQFHPFHIGFNGEGMSLFVTTPLFFYLLWPRQSGSGSKTAETKLLRRELWLTTAVIALPGFFYQNSGYFQFGFRFSLDYTPYLVLLLALGGHRFTRIFWATALAGVAVNAWGAAVFNRLY